MNELRDIGSRYQDDVVHSRDTKSCSQLRRRSIALLNSMSLNIAWHQPLGMDLAIVHHCGAGLPAAKE